MIFLLIGSPMKLSFTGLTHPIKFSVIVLPKFIILYTLKEKYSLKTKKLHGMFFHRVQRFNLSAPDIFQFHLHLPPARPRNYQAVQWFYPNIITLLSSILLILSFLLSFPHKPYALRNVLCAGQFQPAFSQ